MSDRIQQVPNESILVLNIIGGFDTDTVQRAMSDQAKQARRDASNQVVRIIDARYMDQSYTPCMMRLIEDLRKSRNGQTGLSAKTVLVGRPELVDMVSATGVSFPMFTSLERAITHARSEMTRQVAPAVRGSVGEVLQ
jgi:hypothetical protein